MTHFMREGNKYAVAPAGALDITEHLPVGTYKVGLNPLAGTYFLERIDNFEVRGKIYGDITTQRDRILRTFADRPATTGVLLTGEKGSGKTLLAKMLSVRAQQDDIATLVINEAWCGDAFNAFMQAIGQPTVVIFDEFEKVYDAKEQKQLLTLLDGTYTSKKLFVLTANDEWSVDIHMKNRPGRIFYSIDFTGLDVAFVRDYCRDNLKRVDQIEDVARVSRLFEHFNFDLLKALVEEMNRFDENVDDALLLLNARPRRGYVAEFEVEVRVKSETIPREKLLNREWEGNPRVETFNLYYRGEPTEAQKLINASDYNIDTEDEDKLIRVALGPADLKRLNVNTGEYIFETEDGTTVILSEKLRSKRIDYSMVL
jgi:hypothetical protein